MKLRGIGHVDIERIDRFSILRCMNRSVGNIAALQRDRLGDVREDSGQSISCLKRALAIVCEVTFNPSRIHCRVRGR